ncbi:hypothetical protein K239x_51370 [Planctomycetes bacterium K23_9]|uniref:Uncharacterized protein n=1 Tax=Stieleria marina TaxID=1930275 RepID=A0A517P172_9BACT|nr:hypothetical protein K239x_51370 [Planctomycetes bacterium K23_9]
MSHVETRLYQHHRIATAPIFQVFARNRLVSNASELEHEAEVAIGECDHFLDRDFATNETAEYGPIQGCVASLGCESCSELCWAANRCSLAISLCPSPA